jgi:hypothetical protein
MFRIKFAGAELELYPPSELSWNEKTTIEKNRFLGTNFSPFILTFSAQRH